MRMDKYKLIDDFPRHIGDYVEINIDYLGLKLQAKVFEIKKTEHDTYACARLTKNGEIEIRNKLKIRGLTDEQIEFELEHLWLNWLFLKSKWNKSNARVVIPKNVFWV